MMKKMLHFFTFVLVAVLLLSTAVADGNNLPEGIMSILQGSSWNQYEIGRVNYGPGLQDYQSSACYYYDQGNHAAAFVLMHNEKESVLCVFEKKSSGEWYLKCKSSSAVLQNGRIPMITAETYGKFEVSYLDQDRQADLAITFTRRNSAWYVSEIDIRDNDNRYTSIMVYDEKLVISEEKNNWKKRTVQGVTACAFDQFSISSFPMTEEKARETLSLPPEIPAGTGSNSLPNPQRIKFTANKKYAVYSGPGKQYLRSANGKASMSTNDWVQVFGKENDWIMVQYDITSDHMRIGWISEKALPKKSKVDTIEFIYSDTTIISDANLTDDPLFSESVLCTIPAGNTVQYLASMGDWVYIEWNRASQPVRGFIKANCLTNMTKSQAKAAAIDILLTTNPVAEQQPVTREMLESYSVTFDFDPMTSQWTVGFDSGRDYRYTVVVNDQTGNGWVGSENG